MLAAAALAGPSLPSAGADVGSLDVETSSVALAGGAPSEGALADVAAGDGGLLGPDSSEATVVDAGAATGAGPADTGAADTSGVGEAGAGAGMTDGAVVAAGRQLVLTAAHDGRLVDDLVAGWNGVHHTSVDLTGPAGRQFGVGAPSTYDAIEFCRAIADRTTIDGIPPDLALF